MYPVYAEIVIVGVLKDGIFTWYITDKDIWFLDYQKMEKAYQDKGYKVEMDVSNRFGIKTLSDENESEFLKNTLPFSISTSELRNTMFSKASKENCLEFVPAFYVDFDKKEFISFYPEPESFEDFVPEGWQGKYYNFMDTIAKCNQYWVDDEGKSFFERS